MAVGYPSGAGRTDATPKRRLVQMGKGTSSPGQNHNFWIWFRLGTMGGLMGNKVPQRRRRVSFDLSGGMIPVSGRESAKLGIENRDRLQPRLALSYFPLSLSHIQSSLFHAKSWAFAYCNPQWPATRKHASHKRALPP